MRHQRAKAARKTLQHFARTVNLKSKPYYSVLLDATFLIAMIRMTTSNTGNESGKESTIVSRIERVLQVNGSSNSFSGFSRDERLSGVVGESSWNDNAQQSNNNSNSQGRQFERYNVRYFIPQEAVDELETILKTFKERIEQSKNKKKQRKHAEKAKIFEDALAWIKSNKNRRFPSSGRCEILPKLSALVEPPSKKKKQAQQESTENDNEEPASIGASDAVRRHIARDDGREDVETNQRITKKQREEKGNSSISRTFIVASQEENLLDDLRMLGTVPILRCANNASVLILENPSKKGQRSDSAKEHSKWKGALQNPAEKALVDAAWEAQKKHKVKIMGLEAEQQNKRGQNKAKGPNPLSCKRKRNDSQQQPKSGESKSKKRRARAQRNKEQAAASAASKE